MIARLIDWSARNLMLVLVDAVFAVAAGVYALQHSALDAIPDLSDTQVIVYTDYKGQAPQVQNKRRSCRTPLSFEIFDSTFSGSSRVRTPPAS